MKRVIIAGLIGAIASAQLVEKAQASTPTRKAATSKKGDNLSEILALLERVDVDSPATKEKLHKMSKSGIVALNDLIMEDDAPPQSVFSLWRAFDSGGLLHVPPGGEDVALGGRGVELATMLINVAALCGRIPEGCCSGLSSLQRMKVVKALTASQTSPESTAEAAALIALFSRSSKRSTAAKIIDSALSWYMNIGGADQNHIPYAITRCMWAAKSLDIDPALIPSAGTSGGLTQARLTWLARHPNEIPSAMELGGPSDDPDRIFQMAKGRFPPEWIGMVLLSKNTDQQTALAMARVFKPEHLAVILSSTLVKRVDWAPVRITAEQGIARCSALTAQLQAARILKDETEETRYLTELTTLAEEVLGYSKLRRAGKALVLGAPGVEEEPTAEMVNEFIDQLDLDPVDKHLLKCAVASREVGPRPAYDITAGALINTQQSWLDDKLKRAVEAQTPPNQLKWAAEQGMRVRELLQVPVTVTGAGGVKVVVSRNVAAIEDVVERDMRTPFPSRILGIEPRGGEFRITFLDVNGGAIGPDQRCYLEVAPGTILLGDGLPVPMNEEQRARFTEIVRDPSVGRSADECLMALSQLDPTFIESVARTSVALRELEYMDPRNAALFLFAQYIAYQPQDEGAIGAAIGTVRMLGYGIHKVPPYGLVIREASIEADPQVLNELHHRVNDDIERLGNLVHALPGGELYHQLAKLITIVGDVCSPPHPKVQAQQAGAPELQSAQQASRPPIVVPPVEDEPPVEESQPVSPVAEPQHPAPADVPPVEDEPPVEESQPVSPVAEPQPPAPANVLPSELLGNPNTGIEGLPDLDNYDVGALVRILEEWRAKPNTSVLGRLQRMTSASTTLEQSTMQQIAKQAKFHSATGVSKTREAIVDTGTFLSQGTLYGNTRDIGIAAVIRVAYHDEAVERQRQAEIAAAANPSSAG
ncbi:MAG: hypothetical protein LBJ69_00420 [Holosporales bacterium]|jgi:hypothetical protein|nr:hypothetical protein [Holosporales bacterium]